MIESAVHGLPVFSKQMQPDESVDAAAGAVFLIDKPMGWSSFRVVGLLRKLVGIKKVGHAGTLDPMATGLLILCTGKATKQIYLFQDAVKQYQSEITFGGSTPSYDKETPIDCEAEFEHITRAQIEETLRTHFTGDIEQIPPMYAAIKHKGVPLYKIARKGGEVERKPRAVSIYKAEINAFELPKLSVDITCSKGTYIRSFAHDLGNLLESKAHLSALRRTAIGQYSVDQALTVEQLIQNMDPHGKSGISL